MPEITNISCYRFAPLSGLKALRERLLAVCKGLGLRGTILLSTEGINLFVAGGRDEVDSLVEEIRRIPGLSGLEPKYSISEHQPFTRMLVRIKREIIAFGVDGIDPARRTSPKLAAPELKRWLDEGRPVTLLDTRNDYEVRLGTFHGAIDLGISHFRDFPGAVAQLPDTLKDQPVVMFCTGGIRCEKAGPFLESRGFRNVLQLDGGILKYFEECGDAHYRGECFVFDQRVGVDPALRETATAQCYVCQSPLSIDEQKDPRHVPGRSCPYCFRPEEDVRNESLARRIEIIRQLASPLPGSVPYDNHRPVLVPPSCSGGTLLDCLCSVFSHLPRGHWAELCRTGRILAPDGSKAEAGQPVRAGDRFLLFMPGIVEPPVSADIRLIHEDEAIIAVHKPAPLPMHPSGRFNKNTLQFFLAAAYAPQRPRPAHRLDANTTGVVVWSRTRHFARLLQPQFQDGRASKVYLARVQGTPDGDRFTCTAPISREPGELGSRRVDDTDGLVAHTDFRVLSRLPDGTTLVEARPLTGRTNQIRIHLASLGHPVCGDPAYLPGGALGTAMTLAPGDPPLCLHSWRIAFRHPIDGAPYEFEAPAPSWAAGLQLTTSSGPCR